MKDVQNERDYRKIPINKVGIKNLRYPVTVLDRANCIQHTVADINMYVDLPHERKGTHMSRFLETLQIFKNDLSLKTVTKILDEMKSHLGAAASHIEITFPYFIEKKAPVSSAPGFMDYTCRFIGSSDSSGKLDLVSEIEVPVSSVCPCSKEISKYGAHNQRGLVCLKVRTKKFFWIEDLISIVEKNASCDVYSVLKRTDEKFITEKAYNNPKFVEDVVRDIATELLEEKNVIWFSVSAENFESIHNHSAYAYISSDSI